MPCDEIIPSSFGCFKPLFINSFSPSVNSISVESRSISLTSLKYSGLTIILNIILVKVLYGKEFNINKYFNNY
jgi:hypothetical protein